MCHHRLYSLRSIFSSCPSKFYVGNSFFSFSVNRNFRMHNVIFAKEQDCAASLMIMEGRFSVLTPFEILNDADSTQTQSKSKTKKNRRFVTQVTIGSHFAMNASTERKMSCFWCVLKTSFLPQKEENSKCNNSTLYSISFLFVSHFASVCRALVSSTQKGNI